MRGSSAKSAGAEKPTVPPPVDKVAEEDGSSGKESPWWAGSKEFGEETPLPPAEEGEGAPWWKRRPNFVEPPPAKYDEEPPASSVTKKAPRVENDDKKASFKKASPNTVENYDDARALNDKTISELLKEVNELKERFSKTHEKLQIVGNDATTGSTAAEEEPLAVENHDEAPLSVDEDPSPDIEKDEVPILSDKKPPPVENDNEAVVASAEVKASAVEKESEKQAVDTAEEASKLETLSAEGAVSVPAADELAATPVNLDDDTFSHGDDDNDDDEDDNDTTPMATAGSDDDATAATKAEADVSEDIKDEAVRLDTLGGDDEALASAKDEEDTKEDIADGLAPTTSEAEEEFPIFSGNVTVVSFAQEQADIPSKEQIATATAASFTVTTGGVDSVGETNATTLIHSNEPYTGKTTVASFDGEATVVQEEEEEADYDDDDSVAAVVQQETDETLDAATIEGLLLKIVGDDKAIVIDALGKLMKLVGPSNKRKSGMRTAVHESFGATFLCLAIKKWAGDADAVYLAFGVSIALSDDSEAFRQAMNSTGLLDAMVMAMAKHAKNADLQGGGCMALQHAADDESNAKYLVQQLAGHERIIAAMKSFPKNSVIQNHGCLALHNLLRWELDDLKQPIQEAGAFEVVSAAVVSPEGNDEVEKKARELIIGWLDSA